EQNDTCGGNSYVARATLGSGDGEAVGVRVSPLAPPLTCGSSLEVRLARCRRKVSCSHLLREDRRRERASDSFSGGSKDEDGVRPMRVRDAKAGCPEIPLPRYPFFFVAEATQKP